MPDGCKVYAKRKKQGRCLVRQFAPLGAIHNTGNEALPTYCIYIVVIDAVTWDFFTYLC